VAHVIARGAPGEADVRAVLEDTLGDRRLTGVGAGQPLLPSGVVTSIELVSVLVDLERRLGVVIPERAALETSIASIVRALGGVTSGLERARAQKSGSSGTLPRRLGRAARRPAIFVASIVVCLFVLSLVVERLVAGPLAADRRAFDEGGRRLYAYSGAFGQDSFRFALARHEISAAAPPERELRVAVFGDCGTMGSYVAAADAIPARLEDALRARGTPAKVYNLAYYGRLLAKDFMLLELVWDRPLDLVVFTLGDDYLRRSATAAAIDHYRHVTFNWDLFDRFQDRVPAGEQAPFRDTLGRLRRADLIHLGPLRRWEYRSFAILPQAPFLRYMVTVRWLPELFASSMREDMRTTGSQRAALSASPPPLPPKLTHADLDRAQLAMLSSAIRLLRRRGVRVLLYAEPVGPRAWRVDRGLSAASLAARLARETGSLLVDEEWALDAGDFTDSLAHYTPDANRRIGEALAQAIRSSP
jgi:acyl carrier protein